jgi:ATP-dependent DNA helicase RecQ
MTDQILSLLETHFGYKEFRLGQREIIDSVIAGNDNFVLMPTGGGKSLCYQLPALALPGLTLVVSPLIALMKDQVDSLKADGISAEFINSSLPAQEIHRIENEALAGKLKLLYLAPERMFLDNFKFLLSQLQLSLIAVDEAHCISEWGHDFRPEYRGLRMLKDIFPGVPIIALTATATEKVRQDILTQLNIQNAQVFVTSFNRPNLFLKVEKKAGAFEKLVGMLEHYKNESAIIYCFSRKETENVALDLRGAGINAMPYHAGLEQDVRRKTQELFVRDEINVIVATIAFGMGVDKPNVRLVAHYTFPKSLEGYYQEIGRAGRDGLPSECVLFFSRGDAMKHEYFINEISAPSLRDMARTKLREVMDFAEAKDCRRRIILKYFGEDYPDDNCKTCDSCASEKEIVDATTLSKLVINAAVLLGGRFGGGHLIDVLKGSRKKKLLGFGHDRLPVFGAAEKYSADGIKDTINELISRGFLQKAIGLYPLIAATQAGRNFLNGNEEVFFARQISVEPHKSIEKIYDQELFEKLRVIRKRIADSRDVAAFVVFGDRSLQEMAWYLPTDSESFLKISGVGANKLDQFGAEFIDAIKEYKLQKNLESKPFLSAKPKLVRKSATEERTFELIASGKSLKEAAIERGLTEGTIINHLEKLLSAGRTLDISHLKPDSEIYDKAVSAFKACQSTGLTAVFEHLRGALSYDTLRLCRMIYRSQNQ